MADLCRRIMADFGAPKLENRPVTSQNSKSPEKAAAFFGPTLPKSESPEKAFAFSGLGALGSSGG